MKNSLRLINRCLPLQAGLVSDSATLANVQPGFSNNQFLPSDCMQSSSKRRNHVVVECHSVPENLVEPNQGWQRSLPFMPMAFTPPHSQSSRPLHCFPDLPLAPHLHPRVSTNPCIGILRRVTYNDEQDPPSGMQIGHSEPVQS